MAMDFFYGRIKGNIKVITRMTKRKAMVSFTGLTADITKDNGRTANSMAKALTRGRLVWRDKAYGMMGKRFNGWMNE